ncbi:kinetochore protein Spc24 [Octopus bimaculoides]|uniref:kinetochore protein Spc24 n=1 Tax=Octopus bimaculoides TaxID=37653 RepID=UPI00071CABFC|nr:kinetochore protein Spc24 [Octopus bimaculoides]|eukprot:XP_014770550.1 PREDICTED: kinetochore protein Spc24-like [Octopus bimaculoides]
MGPKKIHSESAKHHAITLEDKLVMIKHREKVVAIARSFGTSWTIVLMIVHNTDKILAHMVFINYVLLKMHSLIKYRTRNGYYWFSLETSLEKQVKRKNEEQGEKGVLSPKEKEIQLQVERAKQHKQDASLELEKYLTDMQQCQEQLSKLSVDRENTCDKNSTQLEKIKYDIDLYTHITGIRWQYDGEADDIKGYISKHGFLKPFTLNSRKNSGFFVANYLWDLMEES